MTIKTFFEIMKKEKINVSKINYREVLEEAEVRLRRNANFKGIIDHKIDESCVQYFYSHLKSCLQAIINNDFDPEDKIVCKDATLLMDRWRETLMNEANINLPVIRVLPQSEITKYENDKLIHFYLAANGELEVALTKKGKSFVRQHYTQRGAG